MSKNTFNVGKFGKMKQVSLFPKENKEMDKREKEIHDSLDDLQNSDMNEGQAFIPAKQNYGDADIMATPYKKPTSKKPEESRSSGKRTINNEVDAWLNLGGRAFFVKIEGVSYMTSIDSVQDLLDGKKKGVKLGQIEEA